MHKGSCLCGAVEYEIAGPLGPVVYCHCSRCRKASGSAFNAMSPVSAADFRIVKGQECLRDYRNSAGVNRVFCGMCGSPIIGKRDSAPEIVRVRIGTLDTPVNSQVSSHVFAGSKASWDEILDHAPQYEERP
ncbi:putative glutathione-dependent formaldehyde-activating enzyme [mine drainage metagenome]|uniref:Putative glutathione-dependent formaldehyde-activating enzyme n=1 Tax=mine drainage metagenome TaxID=410659 RepID=A0A1J5TPG8_9ZZZZ